MLSYKDYKKLNESLYGAFNLGLKSSNVVGGIISASSVSGTEAALEAQAEEALEEAKKMKKKMESDEDHDEDEEDVEEKDADEDEDEDEDSEEERDDEEDKDSEEDSDEEDSDEDDEKASDPKFMKKKAKKEWTEVLADLEAVLEDVSNEVNLAEIKKGLEIIKEGAKKGHKKGCDCNFCKSVKAKKEGKDEVEGLTAGQKKLPKALQDAILAKKGKKGEEEDEKCGKNIKKDESAWWNSVNEMLGTEDQKGWDGWTEVGELETGVRDEQNPV